MILLLVCLAAVLAALYAFQGRLIYFPTTLARGDFEHALARAAGRAGSVLAPFDALLFEPPATVEVSGTAILFHGNAGLGLDRAYLAPTFTRRGLRLILAEYPGYGARAGTPSEASLVRDSAALYAAVARAYPHAPIMLVGESLGAGVVVQVAARPPPPSRVVLLTPFLSLAETAARAYRFRPLRYLVRDRFDSEGALPHYTGTVAILVAGRDEVVGAAQGRALTQISRSRGATVSVELPEAGHNSWSALIADEEWTELLGVAIVAQ